MKVSIHRALSKIERSVLRMKQHDYLVLGFVVIAAALAFLTPHTVPTLMTLGPLVGFGGMIIDAQSTLSDAQALTLGTTVSTNTYDTGLATNNLGAGETLVFFFSVDVAAHTSNADETYTFEIIQSAAAALSAPTILAQVAIARATLVAGFKFSIAIPSHLITQRFIGAQYVLGGTGPTITVTTEIQPRSMQQNEVIYPTNIKVSG